MKNSYFGITAFLLGVFLLPLHTFAAGFATQSIFLSQDTVTEGETVLIHGVVSNNDTKNKFTGKLELSDESGTIGTAPVSLLASEASTVSVSWKPLAGTRTITARLRTADGTTLATENATFVISPKPAPAALNLPSVATASTSLIESSQQVQQTIANISPTVAKGTAPVFSTLDPVRSSAAKALDNGIAWSKAQLATTSAGGAAEKSNTFWTITATAALYLFSILLYIVTNAGVFYPVVAVAFFYGLWKLYRRMRRPAYYPY